jgi:hypothetical protein
MIKCGFGAVTRHLSLITYHCLGGIMDRIRSLLGYTVAWLAVPMVMATFIGMNFWSYQLANITGVKVSPWYTGGEEIRTIQHGSYQTILHRPVFDGLLWEKKEGFIQINWKPLNVVPAKLDEEIDWNGEGKADFRIEWDTQSNVVKLSPFSPQVLGLEGYYRLKESLAIRVLLRKSSF